MYYNNSTVWGQTYCEYNYIFIPHPRIACGRDTVVVVLVS